ncbi:MAG: hypothetical protein LJF04_06425 [Gemmatimonadetes bacterium]|nr:hypothetical protein [Gemmatimonadota bacterium]
MSERSERHDSALEPQQVVGGAIQRLAAARLGRAFLPLAVLLLVGLGEMIAGQVPGLDPFLLAVGAPASAGAMLAYGLGVVQRAFGRRPSWWPFAMVGGLVPLAFGVYVLGWRGLRLVARWDGISGVLTGIFFSMLGYWILRACQRLSELETLATVMSLGGASVEEVPRGATGRSEPIPDKGEKAE